MSSQIDWVCNNKGYKFNLKQRYTSMYNEYTYTNNKCFFVKQVHYTETIETLFLFFMERLKQKRRSHLEKRFYRFWFVLGFWTIDYFFQTLSTHIKQFLLRKNCNLLFGYIWRCLYYVSNVCSALVDKLITCFNTKAQGSETHNHNIFHLDQN